MSDPVSTGLLNKQILYRILFGGSTQRRKTRDRQAVVAVVDSWPVPIPLLEDGTMTTLMIALVAGMAIDDRPERISTETEQRLLMDGEWRGTWEGFRGIPGITEIRFSRRFFFEARNKGAGFGAVSAFVDEGRGRIRFTLTIVGKKLVWLGIFKREGERLTIRFADQTRLVLEQVRPQKK